jgi:hypothetical protein
MGGDVSTMETERLAYDYKLTDAVNLFSQYTAMINNFWAFYAAATFAAAGYGLSLTPLPAPVAGAILSGFWIFAYGHLRLLRKLLSVQHSLQSDISRSLEFTRTTFEPALRKLVSSAHIRWISITIHLAIDLCVSAALLWRADIPGLNWLKAG